MSLRDGGRLPYHAGVDRPSDIEATPAAGRDIYTVSRLNREAKALLEGSFPLLWVEGEVSNFSRPGSGHWYFSLKDAQCQVRCAMFANRNRLLRFTPENGMQVLLRVRVSLYEGRGEFQLIAEHMEPGGEGLLRLQFEQLKQRLAAEGIFADAHKVPIPNFPAAIGVITSPTGAALRDVLSVLRRRAPFIPVTIYPVPVQGTAAAAQIARMIAIADARQECDVLILTRGGGSLEDLWPFNEEAVARAIHACTTPIVSGVGHEIDFTIADFAADLRAPTPSAAAEVVSPDRQQLLRTFAGHASRLAGLMYSGLTARRSRLDWVMQRLAQPPRRLLDLTQRVDDLHARMLSIARGLLHEQRARLAALTARLHADNPAHRVRIGIERCGQLRVRLIRAAQAQQDRAAARLTTAARALAAVSPLATLERGYAIVSADDDGRIVRDASAVRPGDAVHARLAHGRLRCTVDVVEAAPELEK